MMDGVSEGPEERLERLLAAGEEAGCLTYEQLNEGLPDEFIAPERLDWLIKELDRRGIRLTDGAASDEE